MADTLVTAVPDNSSDAIGVWGPYWSDKDTAIIVFIGSDSDMKFARTIDAGATWDTTVFQTGTSINCACWFDKETPDDTGNLVHVAWVESAGNNFHYRTIDVSDASLGTEETIDSTITVSSNKEQNRVAITKTVNDNLIAALSTFTEIECYRSTDGGAVWTDRNDVFESATFTDYVLLFPADVDPGDVCGLFWDRSAAEINLKLYDDSANTWTEFGTPIDTSVFADQRHINMDGAIRHSDKHLLIAFHSNDDSTTDDIRTFDLTVDSIASPTVTSKDDVFTDEAESAQIGMFINQQNNDVYVSWISGNPTWELTADVVYKKSTDGMTSFGTEQAYSEATPGDVRTCFAGRTVGDAGGRYQPNFYNDGLTDLFVNLPNDVEFGPVAVVDPAEKLAVINDNLVIPNRNWSM